MSPRRASTSAKAKAARERAWLIFRLEGAKRLFVLDRVRELDKDVAFRVLVGINQLLSRLRAGP